jgi:membrane dipeptidase
MDHVRRVVVTAALGIAISSVLQAQVTPSPEAALVERARAIHARALTLDTHDDIDPALFRADCNYTTRLTTQVDLPKMKEGGLDAAFFIVYVGQGPLTPEGYASAYRQAIEKFEAIHRLTETIAPNQIGLALTPDDVQTIVASGRKVAVIGVENGYPIGTELGRVREFWSRGGRYLSLAHNGHNQLSDSNTGETTGDAPNDGISPFGRQVLAEMNRLGIMVDVSHPSRASMLQAAALSKAPIIASHSAIRALANHSRNLDDEQLLAVKRSGGVVQVVAFSAYINAEPPENVRARTAAINAVQREFGVTPRPAAPAPASPAPTRSCPTTAPAPGAGPNDAGADPAALAALMPDRVAAYRARLAAIRQQYPAPRRATVQDFVTHIDYAVKLLGIDYVGISSDFDGGGGIDGWNSAAETFNVTLELVRRGYSETDIDKLWSGNLLRVWRETEAVARKLQAEAR